VTGEVDDRLAARIDRHVKLAAKATQRIGAIAFLGERQRHGARHGARACVMMG